MQKKHYKNTYPYAYWLLAIVALLLGVGLFMLPRRLEPATVSDSLGPQSFPGRWDRDCAPYFDAKWFNTDNFQSTNMVFFGEWHGSNEGKIAQCLETLVTSGDRVLIEAENTDAIIPCDSLHSAYRCLDDKVECYGFDVPIDNLRRLASDASYRANFIAKYSSVFLQGARSGAEVKKKILSFAEFLEQESGRLSSVAPKADPQFSEKIAAYLRTLAKRIGGLTLRKAKNLLMKENQKWVKKAESYNKQSRQGPTNEALVAQAQEHRKTMAQHNRLFVVAGDRHIDPADNTHIEDLLNSKETVLILRKHSSSF